MWITIFSSYNVTCLHEFCVSFCTLQPVTILHICSRRLPTTQSQYLAEDLLYLGLRNWVMITWKTDCRLFGSQLFIEISFQQDETEYYSITLQLRLRFYENTHEVPVSGVRNILFQKWWVNLGCTCRSIINSSVNFAVTPSKDHSEMESIHARHAT